MKVPYKTVGKSHPSRPGGARRRNLNESPSQKEGKYSGLVAKRTQGRASMKVPTKV